MDEDRDAIIIDDETGVVFGSNGEIGYLDTVINRIGQAVLVAVFPDDVIDLGESGTVH